MRATVDMGTYFACVRCPDDLGTGGDPELILNGCGSSNVDGPDFENYFDCLDCGLFFSAEEARRYIRDVGKR